MQDSPDDRAGDVPGRAAGEHAIGENRPHADGGSGSRREVDDSKRRIASIRRILQSTLTAR
jgi:hypothetical protein